MVKAITAYPQLKLVALVIAVAVWFYGNSRLQEEVTLRVPLSFRVPEGHRLVYQSDRRVRLRLRGPQYLIQRRQEEAGQNYLRLRANLTPEDLDDANGMTEISIDPSWLNVPESELVRLGVETLEPQTVRVRVGRIVEKNMPVEVELSGTPRRGYQVRQATTVPSSVEVRGPAFVLNGMEAIRTQTVALWDVRDDFRRMVNLELRPTVAVAEDIQVPVQLEAEPSQVAVHVEIGGENARRTLDGVPVRIMQPVQFPYEVEIPEAESRVSIVISGLPQAVEELSAESLLAYVDLSDLTEEEIEPGGRALYKETVRVRLEGDPEVSVESVTPEQVTTVLQNPVE